MSYEIVKYVTFNEKDKTIRIASTSNNVTPKYYDPWEPVKCGYEYEQWKRMFVSSLFGGESKFQPSCKSKAKKAFDMANELMGIECDKWTSPWNHAYKKYHYDHWDAEQRKYVNDPELKARYDKFRETWEAACLDFLNALLTK